MNRNLLPHLPAILAVARTRSFARSAAELGVGASAVSHSVRAAEAQLGQPLFARTTRSVALTEAGELFVSAARRAFEEIDAAVEALEAGQREVTGLLRVNAPQLALHLGLTPILAEMTRRHPGLVVEIIVDDALTDIIATRFDAGIRLGEMIAQDMVAVRMTPPCRAIMVASPAYLKRRGVPAALADLEQHNCIGFRLLGSGAVYDWDVLQNGTEAKISVSGTVRVSDPSYAHELALAGIGIAYMLEPLAADALGRGDLREVLADAAIEEPGLFLYFPRRGSEARKLRALIDVVRDFGRRR
jgi:DNA-binding transcriptional LysR family regulator